ncbi:MAG TPA: hypothetical protein VF316_23255 [Polyangiaceae bacterium]
MAIVVGAIGCASAGPSAVVVEIPSPVRLAEPAPAASALEPATTLGRWVGVGRQVSGDSWEMVVDLVALGPGICGHVRYPTIPCAADWICSEGSGRRALRAREHVIEGQDACIDGGEMTMTLTRDGHLTWTWTGSGETAHAVLSRAETPR